MERLVDKKTASSPAEARLVELVRAIEPLGVSETLKQDLLSQVLDQRRTPRPRASFALRPAVGLGVLLLASVTAAATLGHRWIESRLRPVAPVATAELPRPAAPVHERRVVAPLEVEPAPLLERPAVRSAHPRPARTEDPSRVVAAIQALRNDHDPDRAAKLLAEYLKIYPHGALSEEAVALSIEAAAARHSASAATFAEQYLKEYPKGRFRRTAEQALAQRQR